MNTQIIIAGFHRSGTSLTAQILDRAGVFLGERVLPEHASNPHGHFEDLEVKELHERILADDSLTWQVSGPPLPAVAERHKRRMRNLARRRNARHRTWGFKDPRACLFLWAWKEVMPEAKVLLIYRDPAHSCRSLHKREAEHAIRFKDPQHHRFWEVPDLALRMWLAYNRALLEFAAAHREDVLAVSMDMLRGGFPLVGVLNERWGLNLREVPTAGVFDATATARDCELHLVSDGNLVGEVAGVWKELEKMGERTRKLAGLPGAYGPPDTDGGLGLCVVSREVYPYRMEAEFLGFKVRLLERLLKQEGREVSLRGRLEMVGAARRDLKRIVSRLSRSRIAPLFFGLERGFRVLKKR